MQECVGSVVAMARRPRARGRDKQEHQSDGDDSARTPTRREDRNRVVGYRRWRCWATPGYEQVSMMPTLNEDGDGEG